MNYSVLMSQTLYSSKSEVMKYLYVSSTLLHHLGGHVKVMSIKHYIPVKVRS